MEQGLFCILSRTRLQRSESTPTTPILQLRFPTLQESLYPRTILKTHEFNPDRSRLIARHKTGHENHQKSLVYRNYLPRARARAMQTPASEPHALETPTKQRKRVRDPEPSHDRDPFDDIKPISWSTVLTYMLVVRSSQSRWECNNSHHVSYITSPLKVDMCSRTCMLQPGSMALPDNFFTFTSSS